ncbi:hypothetical protein [Calothrix sp. NIES-3974]|uniref:hypothetical protein n=1 Tax=Calothrix sp. NIES-3974 TaxID=2005462 RepID=UPI000B5E91A7|nr:hypothetical protein [Calothrix sp. NIES-3974]BAZ06494.1 hypothetical protein NIES3974_31550 [Calothrix sp. NIES-3974]
MLQEFQRLYPTACLTSELIQIYHGKYIIRASIEIEGTIRATGMAAAETIEVAEDQARQRAISVLPIDISPRENNLNPPSNQLTSVASQPTSAQQIQPKSQTIESKTAAKPTPTQPNTPQLEQIPQVTKNSDKSPENQSFVINQHQQQQISPPAPVEQPTQTLLPEPSQPVGTNNFNLSPTNFPPETRQHPTIPLNPESHLSPHPPQGEAPSNPEQPILNFEHPSSNVTPFAPRNPVTDTEAISQPKSESKTPAASKRGRKKNEPVDLSGIIAQTDVEMQRLGWTPEQGRDYLIKTYKKRGRTLLDENELIDFLNYLKSQPTPSDSYAIDPLAGF